MMWLTALVIFFMHTELIGQGLRMKKLFWGIKYVPPPWMSTTTSTTSPTVNSTTTMATNQPDSSHNGTTSTESYPLQMGSCLAGWKDGSSVGLGCLFAEIPFNKSTSDSPGVNQTTAKAMCNKAATNGRLVEIYSAEQMHFLEQFLDLVVEDCTEDDYLCDYQYYSDYGPQELHYWWIGLEKQEGEWRWISGAPVTFTQWFRNRPDGATADDLDDFSEQQNDKYDILGGNGTCVELYDEYTGSSFASSTFSSWINWDCGDSRRVYPVCQVP